jgi:hypothetical protein
MGLRARLKIKLLDMAHDDGPFAPKPGNWHRHHDLLERIAYSRWLQPPLPKTRFWP